MNRHRDLAADARAIWQAGVEAVRSERLVGRACELREDAWIVCGHRFAGAWHGRVAVVGGGKAGAGMAAAVERALPEPLVRNRLIGWVNVPADCVRPLDAIHLHAARPAGVNEPTEAGVAGSEQMLRMVASLGKPDVCLVLISGGGSALLPAPVPPITIDDKRAVTRRLMLRGATIDELNTVRKHLSRIKGGGLARASRAGHTIALIISDVVGDRLEIIASGPTSNDTTTCRDALAVLEKYADRPADIPQRVRDYLSAEAARQRVPLPFPTNVTNHIIGNNATALRAAGRMARQLGYQVLSLGSDNQGEANEEGRRLARRCLALRDAAAPAANRRCLISGGEPVVHLTTTEKPGRGGRNQQLVLAALASLQQEGMARMAILSGGTDGEDGPTDAAGAWADANVLRAATELGVDPRPYLDRNNAYEFFQRAGGLFKTGPTHTNVMDLRVAVVLHHAEDGPTTPHA